MKTVVLGDIHGRTIWSEIVRLEKPDRVIFIGDYFDSFDISAVEQLDNFQKIIDYKNSNLAEVILLVGNHDYHYFPGIQNTSTSGYQFKASPAIKQIIEQNRHHVQMAYRMGEFLFSHAGVSSHFMNCVFDNWTIDTIVNDLNDLFYYKPDLFDFGAVVDDVYNLDPYGDNKQQSPIWIRPKSLMSANYDNLRNQVIQVVGHTQVSKIDFEDTSQNRYWFIDCLGTSGQYMVIENDKEVLIKS